MRVKVCGITREEDALVALEAGADAIGLVFHPSSPRRVDRPRALRISRLARGRADCVGVLVDSSPAALQRLVDECELQALQLHRRSCPSTLPLELSVPVWPTVGVGDLGPDLEIDWWPQLPIFLDRLAADGSGGTGEVGDWEIARAIAAHRPMWLAGGLGPENVAAAVSTVRPYGVDASSRLEAGAGIKDARLVRAFVEAARSAEAGLVPQTGGQP